MVLKPTKEFLTEALTNNTFDNKSTDIGLRATLDNSFSYLYRLQKNLIQYEEFSYTTRNTVKNFFENNVIADSPEYGDMYFDDKRRVCIDFNVELIPVDKREKYRAPKMYNINGVSQSDVDFYGKEIDYMDLISHNELFYRIPILIFDNKVLRDFKVRVYDDHFVAILPLGEYFMREKKYDITHKENYYAGHNYVLQVINNTNYIDKIKLKKEIGFFEMSTNQGMMSLQAGEKKPFGRLSMTYIKNSLIADYGDIYGSDFSNFGLYSEDKGSYFAVVYFGNNQLGSNLIDVTVKEDEIILDLDETTKEQIKNHNGNFTIRFIFYRYLKKYNGTLGKFIDCREKMIDEEMKASSNIFMLFKNNQFTNYGMPIPKEDLMIFKVSEDNITEDGYKEWEIVSNEKVSCYYPNNYQILNEQETIYILSNGYYYTSDGKKYDEDDQYMLTEDITVEELDKLIDDGKVKIKSRYKIRNIEPNDKIRVYFFYYPEYDLHYENMYKFFYYYLYEKWCRNPENNLTIEKVINAIYFGDLDVDNQFSIDDEKLKEMITTRDAYIMLNDVEIKSINSIYKLFFGDLNQLKDNDLYLSGDLTDEEKHTLIAYQFYTVFNAIVFHDIVNYVYDDIDYMIGTYQDGTTDETGILPVDKHYENTMTAFEYRIRKLKEFIKDDPEALRKYVLCQNKTSIKYDFYFDKEQMKKRLRTEYEGQSIGSLPESCYLFIFEHLQDTNYFSCRIFIDGFLCTEYYQKAYDYQDYIYIPTRLINEDSFVEIETFPTYTKKYSITFTEKNDSVILEFPDNELIKPSLSDLYFKNPLNDNEYYDKNSFQVEFLSDKENYYVDTEKMITAYVKREEKVYLYATLIDPTTEDIYVPVMKDEFDINDNLVVNRYYVHFNSAGECIETLIEIDLPEGLIQRQYTTIVYKNPTDLDYYAKDYSYDYFYHYDSKGKKLSETKYTVEEVNQIIADGGNYNIEDGKIYFLHVGQGYYLEDGSYYTFNGQRIREKDITIDELYRLIHYGDEKGNLYVPISVYETNDAMIIKRNQSYISYDKVAKGNSSLDRTNGVLLANVSKVRITCLDDDLLDKEIEISLKKESSLIHKKMEYTNYPCFDIALSNQTLFIDRFENQITGDYYGRDDYYSIYYHFNSLGYKDEPEPNPIQDTYIYYTTDEVLDKVGNDPNYVFKKDSGSNEYIRVFRDGRLISKNRYELLLNEGQFRYGYPRVQLLDIIKKESDIAVDVTPYRNKLVYYQRELKYDKTDDDLNPNILTIDLRGYIDKPFDIRYFEVYLNGRRISRNNIYPVGPFELKLAGVHSLHNLEIYEKDRDWEYYGCDAKNYYTISDLLNEIFMEDEVRDRVITDITGKTPDNHICEEPEEYERDLSIETYFFEAFYYNRLLPKKLAVGELTTFIHDDIRYNFSLIYKLFYKYDSHEVTIDQCDIIMRDIHEELINVNDEPEDYESIIFNEEINGKRFVSYGCPDRIEMFINNGFNGLSKKLTFTDFGIEEKTNNKDIKVVYNEGEWYIFSLYSLYYYMSTDAESWYRKKITVKDKLSNRYHLYPEAVLSFEDRLAVFGDVYKNDNPIRVNRAVAETQDGKHWVISKVLTDEEINQNLVYSPYFYNIDKVYAKKENSIYLVDKTYNITQLNIYPNCTEEVQFDMIHSIENMVYIVLSDKVMYSTNGLNFYDWNTDTIKDYNQIMMSYTNGIFFYQVRRKSVARYEYYISKDGIHIEEYDPDIPEITNANNTFDLYQDENTNNFYLFDYEKTRNTKTAYAINVVKQIHEGVKHPDPSHVLLLDPDVYYHGDDHDRWNVYMTGNDDEFIEKEIESEKTKV